MKMHVSPRLLATVGMTTMFTLSPSWTGAQGVMAMAQNQHVVVEFTVPVRLVSLDRRVRSGQVICTVIDTKSADNLLGLGGIGIGRAYFSINSIDGGFQQNVKVSLVPQPNVPDSQFAQALKYLCQITLSPDALPGASSSNNWRSPSANLPDGDMVQGKPGSPLVTSINGTIPAP